ncbi:hypothetical protein ACFQBQ_02170 [Granulicella cerasi]|uniref:Energy transducer TonB n=1 Tax=Granulicella cerasi TaxID=741063 RepID=A0ABW1Z4D9_9BACT
MPDFLPPEIDSNRPAPSTHAVNAAPTLSEVKESGGPFASLISNFRDAFFPEKLPPLVLESKPIAVPDRMQTKMSKKSLAASTTFYALLILLFAILLKSQVHLAAPAPKVAAHLIDAPTPPPPPAPPKSVQMGGGGGQKGPTPVTQGHLPKFSTEQIMPPKAPPTVAPKLAVEPTVVMQPNLKIADSKLPDWARRTRTSRASRSATARERVLARVTALVLALVRAETWAVASTRSVDRCVHRCSPIRWIRSSPKKRARRSSQAMYWSA